MKNEDDLLGEEIDETFTYLAKVFFAVIGGLGTVVSVLVYFGDK